MVTIQLDKRKFCTIVVHLPYIELFVLIHTSVDLITFVSLARATVVNIGERNGFCIAGQVSNQSEYLVRCISDTVKRVFF